jgi:hypothetical protein
MAGAHDESDSSNACDEFVHSNVSIIPSLLKRIVFLASLRDPETGQYHERAAAALHALKLGKAESGPVRIDEQVIGLPWSRAQLDRALHREHLAVFEEWLCLDTRQRMAELERYASGQDIPQATLFRDWIDEKPFKDFIPSGTMPVQHQLFLMDMETVLAALFMRAFLE